MCGSKEAIVNKHSPQKTHENPRPLVLHIVQLQHPTTGGVGGGEMEKKKWVRRINFIIHTPITLWVPVVTCGVL